MADESSGGNFRRKKKERRRYREVTVVAGAGFRFEPSQIEVRSGTEVVLTLRNRGRVSHNLHLPGPDKITKTIAPGESDTVRFVASGTGTLAFRCEVTGHAAAGMTGRIRVE